MALRPHLKIVMGIDNLKVSNYKIVDPRYHGNFDWQDERVPLPASFTIPEHETEDEFRHWLDMVSIRNHLGDERTEKTGLLGKFGHEVIEFDSEYGVPNIIGYDTGDSVMGKTPLYALAEIYPEMEEAGYKELPKIALDEDISDDAMCLRLWQSYLGRGKGFLDIARRNKSTLRGAQRMKMFCKNGWNYKQFRYYIEGWAACTLHLFKWIGLDVKPSDLKLMLYWYWA